MKLKTIINVSERSAPYQVNKGYIFGVLLSLAQFNLTYGFFALIAFLPSLKLRKLPPEFLLIAFLLIIQIVWLWSINLFYSSKSWFNMLQISVGSTILIIMLFVDLSTKFIEKMLKSIYLLFIFDFLFNLSIYIYGTDPLGRGAAIRPGDFFPRVGGIFGHPFYSVNISTSALIAGAFVKNRKLILLAIIGLVINGTFRSPLMLVLTGMAFFLCSNRFKLKNIIMISTLFILSVIAATYLTALENSDFVSGNFLRVAAWTNSIQHIVENPFFGTHTFEKGGFQDMNLDTILDYGIAESYYLQLAQDFGIIPAILSFYVLYLLLKLNLRSFYHNQRKSSVPAALAIIVITDSFYGTYFGSVLTTFVYASLCISYRDSIKVSKESHIKILENI